MAKTQIFVLFTIIFWGITPTLTKAGLDALRPQAGPSVDLVIVIVVRGEKITVYKVIGAMAIAFGFILLGVPPRRLKYVVGLGGFCLPASRAIF